MMGEILLTPLCANEITAIPKMLEWLDLPGSLVTIDAMGCQGRYCAYRLSPNKAIIRHIALNLLQSQKSAMKRQSIKRLRKMGGWSDDILSAILAQTFS